METATYEITDLTRGQDAADRVLASGAATVPAWSLTLDATAGPSQPDGTVIPVATTAGPELGEVVVVTESDGAFEAVTVGAVEADDYLRASSLLAGTYAAGSTVQSVTITAPAPIGLYSFEAALDDGRPLRVEWRYSIGGVERRVNEPIQLTRQTHATASTGPAVAYVRQRYPQLAGQLSEAQALDGLAEASLGRVELDLLARHIDPAAFVLGSQGKILLATRIILEAAISGFSPGMRELDRFIGDMRTDYTTQLEAIVIGAPGRESFVLDTEAVSHERPDTTYRSPIGAM